MIHEDPSGYAIHYSRDRSEFVLTRHEDGSEVGRYPTREAAIEAAEADRA